jgi:hypothetical protein
MLLFFPSAIAQNQWLNADRMSDKAIETAEALFMVEVLQRCVALQPTVNALMGKRAGEQDVDRT